MNLAAAHAKARAKNEILPDLQEKYEQAALDGRQLELVPGFRLALAEQLYQEITGGASN